MQANDLRQLTAFFDSPIGRPTLGLLYGRRRLGKSTALVEQVRTRHGFYFEATRVETSVQLQRLARDLSAHLTLPGRLHFADWEEAIAALLALGNDGVVPIVLDEVGHILEADPSFESVLASAFGPNALRGTQSRARVVLCGSAIAMMRALMAGEAPLRGRAGMELVVQPDDFRVAASRLPASCDLATATRVFSVIGGVVGYATDMVGFDLPVSADDFNRWVVDRVLSQGATLHAEATTLLAEDPTFAGRGALLYHSILGAIANGAITAGSIAKILNKSVTAIAPSLNRLIEAGFVIRHEDPIRRQRPVYALIDSFLQFHYAVLEPHGALLRDRDPAEVWAQRLEPMFNSQVRGPVFEEQARTWVRRFVADETLDTRDFVGPSSISINSTVHQIDIMVTGAGIEPAERKIAAIGEAKAGESLTTAHLHRLENLRAALGTRAAGATLLLVGTSIDAPLRHLATQRSDVELVDLERLYRGS